MHLLTIDPNFQRDIQVGHLVQLDTASLQEPPDGAGRIPAPRHGGPPDPTDPAGPGRSEAQGTPEFLCYWEGGHIQVISQGQPPFWMVYQTIVSNGI